MDDLVANLREAVFGSEGTTAKATRLAAANATRPAAAIGEPLQSYVAKVHGQSARITDADIAALRAAGHSEDEIFELTVAAALGAALHSLEAGLGALDD